MSNTITYGGLLGVAIILIMLNMEQRQADLRDCEQVQSTSECLWGMK